MTASAAMSLVFEVGWLALTPWERLSDSASHWGDSDSAHVVIIILSIALVVLLVLFTLASIQRNRKQRKTNRGYFDEYGVESGLSIRECELLAMVANKAGLGRPESVFTMRSAFGRGTAEIIEEAVESGSSAEDIEHLKMETAFLGAKLGFGGNRPGAGQSGERRNRVTTRDIPVGKSLYISGQESPAGTDIEATLVRNSDTELAARISKTVNVVFGETWRMHYYSGASVWEFDAKVVSYDGDTLVLGHSEDIRFVNRRRFLRVPVRLRAFVARFPFMGGADEIGRNETSGGAWAPPRFLPAVVTEIAGPGLRIESELKVEAGERVLVVVNLAGRQGGIAPATRTDGARAVENVGEVKYVKAIQRGFSIAVELTGLEDSEVDELIRATNAASLEASERREKSALLVGQGA